MSKKSRIQKTLGLLSHQELLQLLDIGSAITRATNPDELLTTIRETVIKIIPFHDTGIVLVEPDGLHHHDLLANSRGRGTTAGNMELQEDGGILRKELPGSFVAHAINEMEKAGGPIIEDYESAIEKCTIHSVS
ncbi:hypothetical protein ACX0G7_11595 [Flavitalea antarctica]